MRVELIVTLLRLVKLSRSRSNPFHVLVFYVVQLFNRILGSLIIDDLVMNEAKKN